MRHVAPRTMPSSLLKCSRKRLGIGLKIFYCIVAFYLLCVIHLYASSNLPDNNNNNDKIAAAVSPDVDAGGRHLAMMTTMMMEQDTTESSLSRKASSVLPAEEEKSKKEQNDVRKASSVPTPQEEKSKKQPNDTQKAFSFLPGEEEKSKKQQKDAREASSLIATLKAKSNNKEQETKNDVIVHQENDDIGGYDIVTLVHHDDMGVFVDYGLESWQKFFLPTTATNNNSDVVYRIFAICTPQAYEKLKPIAEENNERYNKNFVLVDESIFPFSLATIGNHTGSKYSWIYQQVLKLYSYRVLSKLEPTPVKELFLLIDSDTVAVRPFRFTTEQEGLPIYNIAANLNGAFETDVVLSKKLVNEVFPRKKLNVQEAYPNWQNAKFTAITHQMMFNGTILNEMLDTIEMVHSKKNNGKNHNIIMESWKFLTKLKRGVLSEWELYMAYLLKFHRDTFVVRQIPYVNWGLVTNQTLIHMKQNTDIVYVSKHDDYQVHHMCCVNSNWGPIQGGLTNWKRWIHGGFKCSGCQPMIVLPPNNKKLQLTGSFQISCQNLHPNVKKGCYEKPAGTLRFHKLKDTPLPPPVAAAAASAVTPAKLIT